jgi:glycosyltransferase involved in cell wall biosynthesis
MAGAPLRRRLQGLYWELNAPLRRWLRGVRTTLSLSLHRARHAAGRGAGPRVVSRPSVPPWPVVADPAIAVVDAGEADGPLLGGQTEGSLTRDPTPSDGAPFIAHAQGLDRLPAAHLEALLMAAAADDLGWVAAGWSPPAAGRFGPSGTIVRDPETPQAAHLLLRRPAPDRDRRPAIVGRVLPHITSAERCAGGLSLADHAPAAGPYRLRPDMATSAVVRSATFPVDVSLGALPEVDGAPTALFLLPFLAVGGAERLLFELMAGLRDGTRLLVVTTDPHLQALGQTVDRARELTPHVYTLGDWLPRDAAASALRHLIRRWRVRSLVSWNGTVLFYDEVAALRRAFPHLNIVHQLFNHRGGWIEHTSPSLIRSVDTHIAVNTPIRRALVTERGVPDDRVATIYHAVGAPGRRDEERRSRLRRELGVDDDTVVVGTFIRMHPQKRPLDVVDIARRMTGDKVHFLLVGGGPLDDDVDREIARDRPRNLTRWPLHDDATPLYDAVDLCLMTSDFEGLPVFLLDGLARSLPCVATAVGDIPSLLRDGGGMVVKRPGDLDGLVAAIRSLLDDEVRRAEGEKARRTVETRFGLDRYIAAYEAVLFRRLSDEYSS